MSTTTLIGGGIGALVFIAGLLFVLRGRGNDEEYHEQPKSHNMVHPCPKAPAKRPYPPWKPQYRCRLVHQRPVVTPRKLLHQQQQVRLYRGGLPSAGHKSSGSTTANNTLMEPFDDRMAWTPILRMVRLVVCCGCLWRGNMVPSPFYPKGTSPRTVALLGTASMLTLLVWTWVEF